MQFGQQDIVGQVLSVSGRPTRNNRTIYDVAFSDGQKYTTFDGEVAQKANALVGQTVSARVEVSQKGQYTNYNILDVAPQGQLAPAAFPQPAGVAVPVPTASPIPMQQGDPQKEARIAKGVAVKVAAEITAGLFSGAGPEATQEALDTFDTVGKHVLIVLTGVSGAGAQQVVPTEQTPEAVAAAVNDAAGTPVVQTGATVPW